LPDSKKLGEIFPELLRQGGIGATKGVREPKYCRFPAEPPQGGVHQGLTAENENAADMVSHAISVAKYTCWLKKIFVPLQKSNSHHSNNKHFKTMKKLFYWVFAATLVCDEGMLTSCANDSADNPVVTPRQRVINFKGIDNAHDMGSLVKTITPAKH